MNRMATCDNRLVGTHSAALNTPHLHATIQLSTPHELLCHSTHHVNDHGVVMSTRNDTMKIHVLMYIWNTIGPTSASSTCGDLMGSANEPNATMEVVTPALRDT